MGIIPPYTNLIVGGEPKYDSLREVKKGSSSTSDTSGIELELHYGSPPIRWNTIYTTL